jgi:AcrR family transcriptional regulator
MAPRAYNNETRQQQQAELKARIAAAAAELHAQKGALATSYAEIAERAGVSLPTVYKHYPDLNELVRGCTGHVAALAPAIPAEAILGAPSLQAAIEGLVDAMLNLHAHFEPWTVWREHSRIPALAQLYASNRQRTTQLCTAVLDRHAVAGDRRELAAVMESLLHFEVWHRLTRVHKLTRAAVRRRLIELLMAALGQQPTVSTSRPSQRRNS